MSLTQIKNSAVDKDPKVSSDIPHQTKYFFA